MKTFFAFLISLVCIATSFAQTSENFIERVIAQQREKLNSADVETRRDAVYQLRLLENAEAARAAAAALDDSAEIVRAEAARAVKFMATEAAVGLLTPLLADKSEFVRRETAFSLGQTFDRLAASALIRALQTDKQASVRAAAAVALGNIADESAITPLGQILLAPKNKENRLIDEFVRRSAARALGEIRHRNAVESLIAALRDETNAPDVRREAAKSLGVIADPRAIEVLTANTNAEDEYLADIATEALENIQNSIKVN